LSVLLQGDLPHTHSVEQVMKPVADGSLKDPHG